MIKELHFWNRSSHKIDVGVHHDGCGGLPWTGGKPKCWGAKIEPGNVMKFVGTPQDIAQFSADITKAVFHFSKFREVQQEVAHMFVHEQGTQTAVYVPSKWVTNFSTFLELIVGASVSIALIALTGGAAAPEVVAADVAGAEAAAAGELAAAEVEAVAAATRAERLIQLCQQFALDYPRVTATANLFAGIAVGLAVGEAADKLGLDDWRIFVSEIDGPNYVPTGFWFRDGKAYFIIEDGWDSNFWKKH